MTREKSTVHKKILMSEKFYEFDESVWVVNI